MEPGAEDMARYRVMPRARSVPDRPVHPACADRFGESDRMQGGGGTERRPRGREGCRPVTLTFCAAVGLPLQTDAWSVARLLGRESFDLPVGDLPRSTRAWDRLQGAGSPRSGSSWRGAPGASWRAQRSGDAPGIDRPGVSPLGYEIAFTTYAFGLARELLSKDPELTEDDVLFEVRGTVRRAAALYRRAGG